MSNLSSPVLGDQAASLNEKLVDLPASSPKLKTNKALFEKYGVQLEHDDLNVLVSQLLKKSKDEQGSNRDIKKRQRKNND